MRVFVATADDLHEIVLDYVPALDGLLLGAEPEVTLRQQSVEKARGRGAAFDGTIVQSRH